MDIYITYWQLFLIILIAIFFLIGLIWFLIRKLRPSQLASMDKAEVRQRWQQIESLLDKKNQTNYQMAIMEADKLFDHVLKDMGFIGSTLGERLKVACYKHPKLKRVWAWHKIRNQLVHEANYHLRESEARKALAGFKAALRELKAL